MRLRVVDIAPSRKVTLITGKNAAGKSAVLAAGAYLVGGGDWCPDVPLRAGEARGEVSGKLGELTIRRVLTPKSTRLEVTAADGSRVANPQAVLDELHGPLSLDPMAFMSMKPSDKRNTLIEALGLRKELAGLEADEERAVAARQQAKRDVSYLEGRLGNMAPIPADTPDQPIPKESIDAELAAAEKTRHDNNNVRMQVQVASDAWRRAKDAEIEAANRLQKLHEAVSAQEQTLATARGTASGLGAKLDSIQATVAALVDPDTKALMDKAANVATINANVQRKTEIQKAAREVEAARLAVDKADAAAKQAAARKSKLIADAKLPVPGMGFNATGVLLNGLPIEQASSAEQLRACLGLAMTMNPKLRWLPIKDGSLLDSASLAIVDEMAQRHNCWVWIEQVNESGNVGIVIEDGEVAAVNEEASDGKAN
jgi:hypothetical protein